MHTVASDSDQHSGGGSAPAPDPHECSDGTDSVSDEEEKNRLTELTLAAQSILGSIAGENPTRDGLRDTPLRFARALAFFTKGYAESPTDILADALFDDDHDEMIIVKGIDVFSLCEHHLVPFFGKAHIAYIPHPQRQKVVGLSKLARLTDVFARRLQLQERLTRQIADAVQDLLDPLGLGVILECTHLCMAMRGVQKVGSTTITRSMRGSFRDDLAFRQEFVSQVVSQDSTSVDDAQDISSSPPCRETTQLCSADIMLSDSSAGRPLEETDLESRDADDYRLYVSCARDEFSTIVRAVREAIVGQISEKTGGFSLLDIGAGNGNLLEALCSASDVRPSRYVAFEPDAVLHAELQVTAAMLGFVSNDSTIRGEYFTESATIEEAAGPFDVVLLSHSLYNVDGKDELISSALRFVAPGGVLLIFHRWVAGGTLEHLSESLYSESIMHHMHIYDIELDLTGLNPRERLRLSRYTHGVVATTNVSGRAIRPMGYIGVEPHSCRLGSAAELDTAIQKIRRSVTYAARSASPAAVVTPNTAVGIQSCLRAAAKHVVGCGSVTVVGGGHSANCIANDAIAIDMHLWDHVAVNLSNLTVRAGGGATIGEITKEAEKHGLAVPLGDRPGVGAGLVLQGGLNHLMRRYGLAVDNLLRVKYINPSGVMKVAESDADLFPFRGAGSNFGVVLEVTLQASRLTTIVAQDTEYTLHSTEGSHFVTCYSRTALSLSETACLDAFIFWRSHDEMAFATSFFEFSGKASADRAETPLLVLQEVAEVRKTDPAVFSPSKLFDRELYMSSAFHPAKVLLPGTQPPKKLRSLKRCLLFPAFSELHGTAFMHAMSTAPTKWCYVHVLHGGGAVKRISSTKTAFGHRNWDFAAVITGRWGDGDTELEESTAEWLHATLEILLPMSVGVYGADLGPSDLHLAPDAFGRNALVLAEMKRRQDPLDILRYSCPLTGHAGSTEADRPNDPRLHSRGVVAIFCGRRFAGKDWLASVVRDTLRSLLGDRTGSEVSVASISDSTKHAYAEVTPGVQADRLIEDRGCKETHRQDLTAFYEKKKAQDLAFDAKCFVDLIQSTTTGIMLLTGMRDGLEYARRLAGRPVLFVHVTAKDEAKRSRGWSGPVPAVDDIHAERRADSESSSFWDLVYENDSLSTADSAATWTKRELSPALLKCCVRDLPNTPRPGINYKDMVGGLLLQPFGLSLCSALIINWLQQGPGAKLDFDAVLAPECLGFLFAGPIATFFKRPVLLARKANLVPGVVSSVHYSGSNMSNLAKVDTNDVEPIAEQCASFHLISGSIQPGQRILVVDDCLASGSTLDAMARLADLQGGIVTQMVCVMEMEHPDLKGRIVAKERDITVFSLMQFSGK